MVIGPHAFRGDERFVLTRELGRGGMGIVYEAYDRHRSEKVALKTLHWANASDIYLFKREFRALANVSHRNLVNLYELVARDDVWFFTMELVEGTDFLEHVRPGWSLRRPTSSSTGVDPAISAPTAPGGLESRAESSSGALHVGRLRAGLRQLAEGVAALHRAGKVHRDLKPGNVLVAESGRVVILDFGIAADMTSAVAARTAERGIPGTVEYMAPEQCAGEPCTPSSDWYSVGVLLYEALTGELPFDGSMLYVLTQKQAGDPRRPDEVAPDLPVDLVNICVSLLARAPAERPSGAELLQRLGASEPLVVVDPHARGTEEATLVGRAADLAVLEDAFAAAAGGQVVAMCVHGPSGIGKTTLVRHFTTGLVRANRAALLDGCCYMRESVPYKALDGVMDMLSRLLKDLPRRVLETRLPGDIAALARVFPVLRSVEAIDRRAGESPEVEHQPELRRRAFAALRHSMEMISQDQPVVIHIDDLQWADRDSADLLDQLLASRGQLPLLFILSFRSEDVPNVPFLERLLEGANTPTRRALRVEPLSTADAAEFALEMLGAQWPNAEAYAETLARESDGNPFLLDQIARFVREAGTDDGARPYGLAEMLSVRIDQMPGGARELVEVLAIAGQPIDAEVAYHAAGLTGDERPLVSTLRVAHLLRAGASGETIDLYHDRIRESFVPRLSSPATRTIHRRLAEGLEAKGIEDAESLYAHYLGAGETTRAAAFAARAAQVAQAALAFERAASFYQRSLDLFADAGPETEARCVGLGDALACAGRGGEAAKAYLRATAMADDRTAMELERRAGQQLLISGRIDEGLKVIGRVLAKMRLTLAPSPKRALALLIMRRIRLRLRGLRYHERSADEIPAEALTRIDTCWAVAEGMALVDNIQGASFQTLHLILALKAGEPNRVARALAMEAGFIASSGSASEAARLLREAEHLARRLDSDSTIGLCKMIGAVMAFHLGQSEEAEALVQEAEAILVAQQSFAAWQLNIARVYHIPILIELGKVAELCRLSQAWFEDALDRGNLFAATMFRTGWCSLAWLSADDVTGAREALRDALQQRRREAFYLPDFMGMLGQALIDLYAGEGEAAYRHVSDAWPRLERSQLLRIGVIRVRSLQFRAGCALAAASAGHDRDRLLRVAQRDARQIEREQQFSARANRAKGQLLRAGIQATRGNHAAALEQLAAARDGFQAARSPLWQAVAKRRTGELLGGDQGDAMITEADAWMASQNITNPVNLTMALAPGFGRG